jgi:pilus assembly protein CpaE
MEAKILIVDDDIDTLQLVGTMLERQGYEIAAANNGVKAVEMARQERPDLILLDVMMPGMDGYEVTRKLRAMEETALIPIIMFTAKAQVDDKVAGFESGADDYLTKPTHPAELIARVKTVLTRPQTGSLKSDEVGPPSREGQIIGVLAAKGGLGVSTVALNLGVAIHQQRQAQVTVAELRPGQGDIGLYLGYNQAEGLSNLLRRAPAEISPPEVEGELISHGSGILLLLASHTPAEKDFAQASEQHETIVQRLRYITPYTIVDLGVGLPQANRKIARLCDNLIVVLEPSEHAILRTKTLLTALEELGIDKNKIHVVLNNRLRLEINVPASQVQEQLGYSLSAVLTPAPELAYQAAVRHEPMIIMQPSNLTSQQILKLADVIAEPAPVQAA